MEWLNELHNNYGISKTREAEDMCNYSQYLVQKGKKEGRERGRKKEGREDEKLEVLAKMDEHRYNDNLIMELLGIDVEQLKNLRSKLQARQSAMADD